MTSFPGSPRLLKGALISIDLNSYIPSAIFFQYNPASMTRRLEARSSGNEGGERTETLRLVGPPRETLSMSIELDAADQLERGDAQAQTLGVLPALASLEMLLYPSSIRVITNLIRAQAGDIEIIPPEAPLTLLVWGATRVLPVRLSEFSITEEIFDPSLNPIQAKVDLSFQVLSTADLKPVHPGYGIFLAHQIAKEVMSLNLPGKIEAIAGTIDLL
jgi:hypothetical protein